MVVFGLQLPMSTDPGRQVVGSLPPVWKTRIQFHFLAPTSHVLGIYRVNQGWDLCLPSKRKEKKTVLVQKILISIESFWIFLFYFYFSVMNIPDFFSVEIILMKKLRMISCFATRCRQGYRSNIVFFQSVFTCTGDLEKHIGNKLSCITPEWSPPNN